jgi:hypothetical protein
VPVEENAPELPAVLPADVDAPGEPAAPRVGGELPGSRRASRRAWVGRLIRAVRDSDVAAVEEGVLRLSFFLNAVFAFAIAGAGRPVIRPAFAQAWSHLAVVLGWGAAVGIWLGLSTVVFVRWRELWFALSLSIVIGVMMVCYVAIPSRLIGVQNTHSKRDKLTATAVGGAVGAVVCTPPYALARVGLLMLGSHTLFIPGCLVLPIG